MVFGQRINIALTFSNLTCFCETKNNPTIMFLFSAERVNQAPKAILNPLTQTVLLPTKQAIIDASGSTDDTEVKELTYNWYDKF